MRVHITTEEYVVIDDVVIDDIVWNKNPESRFQTKLDEFVITMLEIIYYVNFATTYYIVNVVWNKNPNKWQRTLWRIVKAKDKCILFRLDYFTQIISLFLIDWSKKFVTTYQIFKKYLWNSEIN